MNYIGKFVVLIRKGKPDYPLGYVVNETKMHVICERAPYGITFRTKHKIGKIKIVSNPSKYNQISLEKQNSPTLI